MLETVLLPPQPISAERLDDLRQLALHQLSIGTAALTVVLDLR